MLCACAAPAAIRERSPAWRSPSDIDRSLKRLSATKIRAVGGCHSADRVSTFADEIPEAGRARALPLAQGADAIEHPGGTLYEHLGRVLAAWGAGPVVQLAGLRHAFYGTDGFQPALLALSERGMLTQTVGRDVPSWIR